MVKFECTWCGKCCASFGQFIRIERQLNEKDYYCRYGVTGEVFPVHVLPEYAGEFADEFDESGGPGGEKRKNRCVFMHKKEDGEGFSCIIYPSRPQVCREFRCYRMLIYNREGRLCGRVVGRSNLVTEDGELLRIWNEKIAGLPHNDDSGWERDAIALLSQNGYRADPVEK